VSKKMLFCRIAWMDHYRGMSKDKVRWGGGEIEDRNWWEIQNFEPVHGRYYGNIFLNTESGPMTIHIENLGAGASENVEGVLVVWVAFRPNFGPVVVGWYEDATVYRQQQELKVGRQTRYFYTSAKTGDSVLLDLDQRFLLVPRGKGAMGQHNTWFAPEGAAVCRQVVERIAAFRRGQPFLPARPVTKRKPGWARQPDAEKRLRVELAATACATAYFKDQGYDVKDVSRSNQGWDLEARWDNVLLKLEVKGLSGDDVFTELTPNEYAMSSEYRADYRICIVTDALRKPRLRVFNYSANPRCWVDRDGTRLDVKEITVKTARLSLKV
jgi:hypothetical protein